jgi:hypothetical protein
MRDAVIPAQDRQSRFEPRMANRAAELNATAELDVNASRRHH